MTDDNTPDPDDEQDLGEKGKAAIKAERARATAAERELRTVQQQLQEAISRAETAEAAKQSATDDLSNQQRENLRLNVAITKGLDASLLKRLQGDDEESLSADADELLRLVTPVAPAPTTPRADPSQGSRTPSPLTAAQEFAAAMSPVLST
jgi:hypothetical protein